MKMEKKRLDILLVEKRLVETSEKGRRLILAGLVEVKGLATPPKAGMRLSQDAEILVHEPLEKYVSRGGIKLAHALNHFHIQPRGCTCLDLGASTGGLRIVFSREAREACMQSMWDMARSITVFARTPGSYFWNVSMPGIFPRAKCLSLLTLL